MSNSLVTAFIALGSNINNPKQQILDALQALSSIAEIHHIQTSALYQSTPLGKEAQPDYINAVAAYETELSAHDLLTVLQAIEKQQGRTRTTKRWGPRTLDLDLLLYGSHVISTPRLIVPHPEMFKRNFVLYPLADIAPDLIMPDGVNLQTLLANCPTTGLIKI